MVEAARGSKLTCEQFAAGIIRVVNSTMEKAIRVVSIERGYDPREFTLVAFGGAGGLHACELAEALSIPRVLIPALPGALSAFGILVSDVVKDYSRTVLLRAAAEIPAERLQRNFATLRRRAEAEFRNEDLGGAITHQCSVDVRYQGQGYELNIPYTPNLIRDFRLEHQRRYGYSYPTRDVELVTLRLRSSIKSRPIRAARTTSSVRTAATDVSNRPDHNGELTRTGVFFGGKKTNATIHGRDSLRFGEECFGPAIIAEYSATTIVPAGLSILSR